MSSESLLGGYDPCNIDDDSGTRLGGCDDHSTEDTRMHEETPSTDDEQPSDGGYADANDQPSNVADDDEVESSPLACALQSMIQSDAARAIWVIHTHDGMVGYAQTTNEVESFFERVLSDVKFRHDWASRINLECCWARQSGVKTSIVVRVVNAHTLPLWQHASTLATYQITLCSPINL